MKIKSSYSIYVVFVHYGNKHTVERCRSDLKQISESIGFIAVDTSDVNLSANYAYEFSGYQAGLMMALENLENDFTKIIFLNDTIYSSHSKLLRGYTLNKIVTHKIDGEHIIGIGSSWTPGILSSTIFYFPTFIFGLQGSRLSLSSFKFYDIEFDSNAWREQWEQLPSSYKSSINSWLQPTSFLKGWYKASPSKLLHSNILRRKQYTIYQEHTLLIRAQNLGFTPFDLGTTDPYTPIFHVLKILDRLASNFDKVIYRLIDFLKARYAK